MGIAWYTIWVSIPIQSIVLILFLAFITLSDLYYSHNPPSGGCTFRSRETGILYVHDVPPPISRVWSQLNILCSRFYLSFTVSQITTVYCIAKIQLISIFIFMTPSLYFQTECHKNMSCLEKSQTVGILKQVLSLETDHFGKLVVSAL